VTGRALVLGGGGVTGVAWELGMLAGLAESGVDLRDADVFVGTSAGSVVAAQITSGTDLEELYQAQISGYGAEAAARLGLRTMAALGWAAVSTRTPQAFRVRVGRMALAARTVPEQQRRTIIESRLRSPDWPERALRITAIDAATGELVVFDKDSGVALVDAVGASCAVPGVWPPVTIDGRRYIDGGIRSSANADLAAEYARVVVLAPITRGGGPMTPAAQQVAALPRAILVGPDAASVKAIGRNMLDPARRAGSARAGRAQAASVAAAVADVWSGEGEVR